MKALRVWVTKDKVGGTWLWRSRPTWDEGWKEFFYTGKGEMKAFEMPSMRGRIKMGQVLAFDLRPVKRGRK